MSHITRYFKSHLKAAKALHAALQITKLPKNKTKTKTTTQQKQQQQQQSGLNVTRRFINTAANDLESHQKDQKMKALRF